MNQARLVSIALLALIGAGATELTAQERRYIEPRSVSDTTLTPLSGAVLVGNTLYISGLGGQGATPEEEARSAMNNLRRRLEAANMTVDDLVWVQVFCSDLALYDTFNRVYRTFFTNELPARAFIGSGTLLFESRFEILGIAVKR